MTYHEQAIENKLPQYRILRLPEVKSITGLSRTAIYDRIAKKSFPKQISLGSRAVGWTDKSVQGWIKDQINASQGEG